MGICGEGGRYAEDMRSGGSSREFAGVVGSAGLSVLGEKLGSENRGLNLGRGGAISRTSRTSRASMRMGYFSDRISVTVVVEAGEEEVNGLSVRIGIVLVD